MAREHRVAHLTTSAVAEAGRLPGWATLVRAPNPSPMTLDGTNTWVLRGEGAAAGAVVVDPGPADEGHLRAVAAHRPIAILVTHRHPDHVDGLARLQELTGAPEVAAAELPAGSGARAGLTITPIATGGHTADSVCFLVESGGEPAILTGDTILGRGTTVVAWPDGDLGDYLASLTRLASDDLAGVPVLPGHGPALADCAAAATFYLAHRQARLDQIRAAVAAGATTPAAVVAQVYGDVDPALRPAAEWSARAHLAYLGAYSDRADLDNQLGNQRELRESLTPPRPLDEP